MGAYVWQRAWQGAIALFGLALVVFLLSRATGDPLALLLPTDAPPDMRARVEARLGLDRSIPEQLLIYFGDLLRGDFGVSIRHREPVLHLFLARFPNSLQLIVPSFLLAVIVGIPLGAVAATSRSRGLRGALRVFGTIGMATPVFWLGLVFIFFFSVRLGILPSGRMGGWQHHVLPVVTLALFLLAGILRLVRSSMLEAMGSDYVKLGRLSGLDESAVVWKHALRNSLIATTAFIGVYFSILITGSIVVEKIFAWPGVGRMLYEGIIARDYPLVQGIIVISAGLIIVINLAVDILHAYLDPRIRP